MPIAEAVERAITECIQEGILKEFLEKHRAEAKKVSIYEYDEARHIRQEREAALELGEEKKIKRTDPEEAGKREISFRDRGCAGGRGR